MQGAQHGYQLPVVARPRVGLAAEVEAVRIQCHGVLAAAEIERALPVASALVMGPAQGVGAVAGQQGAGVVGHGGYRGGSGEGMVPQLL
ncbi:hypothetical protein G6F24_017794 [Rhizopus arrhizus]|nr:hypothetical protein G6F24_017794 [Rhizopus arrhizus]